MDPETTLRETLRASTTVEGPEPGGDEVTAKVIQLTQNFPPGPLEPELTTTHPTAPRAARGHSGLVFLLGKLGLDGQAGHSGPQQSGLAGLSCKSHCLCGFHSGTMDTRAGRLATLSTYSTSEDAFPPWKHPTCPGGSGPLGGGQTTQGDHTSTESQTHCIPTQPSRPPITPTAPTFLSLAWIAPHDFRLVPVAASQHLHLGVYWAPPTQHSRSQLLIFP